MNDYRTKRRYRQQKLERSGFYHRRRLRSRARLQASLGQTGATTTPSMQQIFASEHLIQTYYKLQHQAGHAPGPDGVSYCDLGNREACQIMRQLSKDVLSGNFEPSKARSVRIPKANGRGHRTLKLRSIVYRVVAAALADALGPFFDRMFLPGSHGYRPHRGTWSMLLDMERIMIEQQRFVIAQDDIRNAFDNLPIEHVLQLCRQYICDEKLLTLMEKILHGNWAEHRAVGIDQGSPLSPLMLNVALHHQLDTPFSQNVAHPPWLRYADNLAYPCQSVHEGMAATQAAQELLNPVGMSLKGEDGQPVDLLQGQTASILGFAIRWEQDQITYDLTEEAWASLTVSLSSIHTHSSPDAALQAVRGWMEACGPAFESKLDTPILNRILEGAAEVGYRELPRYQLKRLLQSSRDRWAHRRHAREAHIVSRGTQDLRGEAAPLATDRTGHLDMPEARSPQTTTAAVLAPI